MHQTGLAQVANVMNKYMGNHGKKHWQVVKYVLRFLEGTTNIGLVYHVDMSCALTGYLHYEYVIDLDARRSMTGYTFSIGNSFVSWKETLQPIVALSTTEATHMALAKATKEGIWLKSLISNPRFPQEKGYHFL